jgi:hypothetical protein
MNARHIGISYNFAGDINFVEDVASFLGSYGLAVWFIGRRGPDCNSKNWQVEFIDAMVAARGVLVVVSNAALPSIEEYGRGMWSELPLVRFLGDYDLDRVLLVKRTAVPTPAPYSAFRSVGPLVTVAEASPARDQLRDWAARALAMPPVPRPEAPAEALYRPAASPVSFFEKSGVQTWYELERLDLYDEVWRCRRCGLRSESYIRVQQNPPVRCPRCDFGGR